MSKYDLLKFVHQGYGLTYKEFLARSRELHDKNLDKFGEEHKRVDLEVALLIFDTLLEVVTIDFAEDYRTSTTLDSPSGGSTCIDQYLPIPLERVFYSHVSENRVEGLTNSVADCTLYTDEGGGYKVEIPATTENINTLRALGFLTADEAVNALVGYAHSIQFL